MKKSILTLLIILAWTTCGWAVTIGTYTFYDIFENTDPEKSGEGFVTMVISTEGNTLKAVIENESKTTLEGSSLPNISVITGFAFDFDYYDLANNTPALTLPSHSWSLSAYSRTEGNTISTSPVDVKDNWTNTANGLSGDYFYDDGTTKLETSFDRDFVAQTGIESGFYNPELVVTDADHTDYFTTATFEITFNSTTDLALKNVFVRMQRVGYNEKESLKLVGLFTAFEDGGSTGIPAVPEPGTLILLGSGIVGLALLQRRRSGR